MSGAPDGTQGMGPTYAAAANAIRARIDLFMAARECDVAYELAWAVSLFTGVHAEAEIEESRERAGLAAAWREHHPHLRGPAAEIILGALAPTAIGQTASGF